MQGVARATMEIVPSPLQVKITAEGIAKKVVSKDETFFLSGEDNSLDPDDPGKVSVFEQGPSSQAFPLCRCCNEVLFLGSTNEVDMALRPGY